MFKFSPQNIVSLHTIQQTQHKPGTTKKFRCNSKGRYVMYGGIYCTEMYGYIGNPIMAHGRNIRFHAAPWGEGGGDSRIKDRGARETFRGTDSH